MNDELDKLSDAELSELFAVEVAGWVYVPDGCGVQWFVPPNLPPAANLRTNRPVPQFSTDTNAVLPWLEKWKLGAPHTKGPSAYLKNDGWSVVAYNGKEPPNHANAIAVAPTFARAACIALIRAKRARADADSPLPKPAPC